MKHAIFCTLPVLAVLAALMLICPGEILADGGFVSPPEYLMYEPAQQAFLDFDRASGTEQLSKPRRTGQLPGRILGSVLGWPE